VARLLVERGARVESLWEAAALGITERVEELLASDPLPTKEDLDEAFYQACHGGQLRMAALLLARGADVNAKPGYSDGTPLDIAGGPGYAPRPARHLAGRARRNERERRVIRPYLLTVAEA
jgi:hypothetical protein